MSRYRSIQAVQRPFPFAIDENDRVMYSCNFDAVADSLVTTWEEDILSILHTANLATLYDETNNTGDTLIGAKRDVPTGPGPYITLIDTGGLSPENTISGDAKYDRLSIQIITRASSLVAARTRALSIYAVLDGLVNFTV